MGNLALSCFRGKGKVRVVLVNGDIAEFQEPVTASSVMKKYPHHFVLHCAKAGSYGTGRRRRMSVLKPGQSLRKNQNYLLMPMQSTGSSRSFLDSWAFFSLNACNKKLNEKIMLSNPNRRRWFQKMFAKIFKSSPSLGDSREEAQPLLSADQSSDQFRRRNVDGQQDWEPSLECIPESPTYTSPYLTHSSSYSRYPRLELL